MRPTLIAAIAFSLFIGASHAAPAKRPPSVPAFVEDEVLVKFVPGTPAAEQAQAHGRVGGSVINTLERIGIQQVKLTGMSVEGAVEAYGRNPNVLFVDPNHLRVIDLPSEGIEPWPYGGTLDFMNELWGLHNTGQLTYYDQLFGTLGVLQGTPDADIDFEEAWTMLGDLTVDEVVIAVLDSGVDCSHPELAPKCQGQTPYNATNSIFGLSDYLGHGTHVAGTAAATTDNGSGIASPGWNARIAPVKVCYEQDDFLYGYVGVCADADIAEGLGHAADMGYPIANMSLAGPQDSSTVRLAVDDAVNAGVLVIAGAGNNYDPNPMYPAAYSNVLGVGATDRHDNLAYFSTFGPLVSMLAPGDNVISTYSVEACGEANCYGWLSGTSMATPHVSGSAALVMGYLQSMGKSSTAEDVRSVLETSADQIGALGQNMTAWSVHGRLNLHKALQVAQDGTPSEPPPEPDPTTGAVHVGDLDATTQSNGGTWTATVTVTVHDGNHQPLDGIQITGQWHDGWDDNSCWTGEGGIAGACSVSNTEHKREPSMSFAITGVGHIDYDAADNHDPEGDSDDGTFISVSK
jgi:thermitase